MDYPELFTIWSKMPSEKYGELTINWFVFDRTEKRDCKPYLKKPDSFYDANFINECFTIEEAKQLEDYMKRVHADSIEMEPIEPPIKGILAYGDIGQGGGHRLIVLSTEKEYDLPFKVEGHYYLFQNIGYPTEGDPDFDIKIEGGFVETAGGTPIGMTSENKIPLRMMLDYLDKMNKKDKE
jgi:hypothetical protein